MIDARFKAYFLDFTRFKTCTLMQLYRYCTMLGVYLISSAPIVHVTPLETPFGLVIPLLQSQSRVTTIAHKYFSRCATFTQLTITYTVVTTIAYNTIPSLH
jgi:hypothetical protein